MSGEAAWQVADYIHRSFYSAVARDRHRPARVELSRLTVRQHRHALADIVGSFRDEPPAADAAWNNVRGFLLSASSRVFTPAI